VAVEAEALASRVRELEGVRSGQVTAKGPAPAPIARLRDRYRFRIQLRAIERASLRHALQGLVPILDNVRKDIRASLDVDPVHML
jgi:primosomal protein N' (replication factor Y)